MKVLVACEESQAVCKAFRDRGHDAFSCDIQLCSGGHPEWHILTDVLSILDPWDYCDEHNQPRYGVFFVTQDGVLHEIYDGWDLIIAHPPCTYLSKAGASLMFPTPGIPDPDRLAKAARAKEFFMRIYNAECPRICIENPVPLDICGLPPSSQVIQPYWFGEPYSKRTLLWLKGLPPLFGTLIEPEFVSWTAVHSSKKMRSKTFPGVAEAMASQWGSFVSKFE